MISFHKLNTRGLGGLSPEKHMGDPSWYFTISWPWKGGPCGPSPREEYQRL